MVLHAIVKRGLSERFVENARVGAGGGGGRGLTGDYLYAHDSCQTLRYWLFACVHSTPVVLPSDLSHAVRVTKLSLLPHDMEWLLSGNL